MRGLPKIEPEIMVKLVLFPPECIFTLGINELTQSQELEWQDGVSPQEIERRQAIVAMMIYANEYDSIERKAW